MNYDHVIRHIPIHKAALCDDWESVNQMFQQDPSLMTTEITRWLDTPLMIAVGTNQSHRFVKHLVERIVAANAADKLFLKSWNGNNPLHYAAKVGNTIDAKILVEQKPDMTLCQNPAGHTPLKLAAFHRHKDTLEYLLTVTPDVLPEEEGASPYTGVAGGDLITNTIQAGLPDVALEIVARYPNIVLEKNDHQQTALEVLATRLELFSSGSRLGFWNQLVYSLMPMNKWTQESAQDNIFSNVINKIRAGFWNILRYLAPSIKNIHDIKVKHIQSNLLAKRICRIVIAKVNHEIAWDILGSAISAAVKYGTAEVVKECISTYPDIVWFVDKGFHLSLEAITQREERVYNLLWKTSVHKVSQASLIDNNENENPLHKVAKLAPPHRLEVVTGSALQMQRELRWFKEVQKYMEPYMEAVNKNGKTPRMLFNDEHKDLHKEAQQWMKDTSSSCSVVAALIVTVAFAAAFTIPGGNKDDGKPLFLHDRAFVLFIVSDAIALFSSSTSVLMFLGILTSRYAQDDFLYSLPKRMTIGGVSLFMSLAATMIAFSAALALVFQDEVPCIAAPLAILTCIPLGLFGRLQIPLLVELVYSTYGPDIFQQKN